jgi:hypothetical protein
VSFLYKGKKSEHKSIYLKMLGAGSLVNRKLASRTGAPMRFQSNYLNLKDLLLLTKEETETVDLGFYLKLSYSDFSCP